MNNYGKINSDFMLPARLSRKRTRQGTKRTTQAGNGQVPGRFQKKGEAITASPDSIQGG